MAAEIRKPPRLREGDTVGLVAPANPWFSRSDLLRGLRGLEAWGLNVRIGEHVDDRHGYMAGSDADRAADLNAMWRDPEVRAIVCLTGGYGSPRIVPLLDREAIAANPKLVLGYSDITALHLAVAAWGDTITLYSNGAMGVGAADVTEFSKATLHRALFSDEPYGPIGPNPEDPWVRTISGGRATGRLIGGCFGLVEGTIGTPWEIDTRDRILFLESTVEHETYLMDNGLTHLRNAGKLDGVAGIVIGDMPGKHSGEIQELSLEDVLEELLQPLGVPVIAGLPIGHGKHHATVPIGALATLDGDAGTLTVDEVITAD
ncbi:MAG TPA: LD-carboxypeptidase [Candidatus Limnocylindrales bacterium]|nr:LD-carboxypeptidase [Candidatus Limnocylindrales bacterium]